MIATEIVAKNEIPFICAGLKLVPNTGIKKPTEVMAEGNEKMVIWQWSWIIEHNFLTFRTAVPK